MMWLIWRFRNHSHGLDNMEYFGRYYPGQYEMYKCKKCRKLEAL